jgi:hypothetical protein
MASTRQNREDKAGYSIRKADRANNIAQEMAGGSACRYSLWSAQSPCPLFTGDSAIRISSEIHRWVLPFPQENG